MSISVSSNHQPLKICPYRVECKFHGVAMWNWVADNVKPGDSSYGGKNVFYFANESDAVAFKLRFGL